MAEPERYLLADAGRFPNSRYPVLVYRGVASGAGTKLAALFEQLFGAHAWPAAWRNGLYTEHHYHSTAHEALGVYQGWVKARLGGERGELVLLEAGDVVVIPAGVAHCNEGQSKDFWIVGAYPRGTDMDMNYGQPTERPAADRRIRAVPLPEQDPVLGAGGALLELWRSAGG
ncbi:MAG: cupin domain-containing protein [Deltaproteobacteria bacterium]